MAGSIVRRYGHSIDERQVIHYDDRPATWDEGDALAGHRIDRRKAFAIIDGELCETVRFTLACSGCSEDICSKGFGCRECGYMGVRREGMYTPYLGKMAED